MPTPFNDEMTDIRPAESRPKMKKGQNTEALYKHILPLCVAVLRETASLYVIIAVCQWPNKDAVCFVCLSLTPLSTLSVEKDSVFGVDTRDKSGQDAGASPARKGGAGNIGIN